MTKPAFEVADNPIAESLIALGDKLISDEPTGDHEPAKTVAGGVINDFRKLAGFPEPKPPAVANDLEVEVPKDLNDAIGKPANKPLLRPAALMLKTALAGADSKAEQDQAAAQLALHAAQGAWAHAKTTYTSQRKALKLTFENAHDQAWDEYLQKLADRVAPSVELQAHYTMANAVSVAADTFHSSEGALVATLAAAIGNLVAAYAACANEASKAATGAVDTKMAAELTYWGEVVKLLTS